MVKFNFWDKYFGNNPQKFQKEATKQIKQNTLYYLQKYGRARWISVEEIFKETLEQSDLWKDDKGRMFFAESGIRNKINGITHTLRRESYPIISGKGKRGYRYADEKCKDFIDRWNEKFSAWDERKNNLSKEREIDIALIEKIIEKLKAKGRELESNQLQEIIVKYKNKNIEIENEN